MLNNSWSSSLTIPVIGGDLKLDLTEINKVEARIPEVAFVTPGKAPELLALFNNSVVELIAVITKLELEICRAKREAGKIHSRVVLDEVKDILKAKGLAKDSNPAGSADLREAVLEAHEEYQNSLERVEILEAVSKLIQGKKYSIEMAYSSVKAIFKESGFYYRDPAMSGGDLSDLEIGKGSTKTAIIESKPTKSGWSKPSL